MYLPFHFHAGSIPGNVRCRDLGDVVHVLAAVLAFCFPHLRGKTVGFEVHLLSVNAPGSVAEGESVKVRNPTWASLGLNDRFVLIVSRRLMCLPSCGAANATQPPCWRTRQCQAPSHRRSCCRMARWFFASCSESCHRLRFESGGLRGQVRWILPELTLEDAVVMPGSQDFGRRGQGLEGGAWKPGSPCRI